MCRLGRASRKGETSMTNKQIIEEQRVAFMKAGVLKSVGKLKVNLGDKVVEIDEPEEIHTYAAWKSLGYCVKKGEKSQIKFPIWKYASKTSQDEETGEEKVNGKMFMKVAAFFTPSQVEKMEVAQ